MIQEVNILVVGFPKVGLPIVGWESRGETAQKPEPESGSFLILESGGYLLTEEGIRISIENTAVA